MDVTETTFDLLNLAELEHPEELLETAKEYEMLMTQYRCAMLEIKTKLEVLEAEMSLEGESNPFEAIHCRIKHPQSIADKLKRKGCSLTIKSIEENVNDVAGIRVICSFPEDIYLIADRLANQDDITVIKRKDYIDNPKSNGYRSLHLILQVPIFLLNETKPMKVEVQFRTIAMDFWASLEHKVRYKKDLGIDSETIENELRECAEDISRMDLKMQSIRKKIRAND